MGLAAFLLAGSTLSFLTPTILSFSSFHGLVVWDWGLWTDRVFSLSPGLAQLTQNDDNDNNNNNNIDILNKLCLNRVTLSFVLRRNMCDKSS